MRVVAFVNNRVGAAVVQQLAANPSSELVGLVLHPQNRSQFREEIIAASSLRADRTLGAEDLSTSRGVSWLSSLRPEIGCSAYFGYILPGSVLDLFPLGVFNVHPGLLPYNRGSFPNVWSIVEDTPAGVTIHRMDEGVDTGPIVTQQLVAKRITDTGETLYRRLEDASTQLFSRTWPRLVRGDYTLTPQNPNDGSSHRRRDVHRIDLIELNQRYLARDLIDRLRARTFAGHEGCYFLHQEGKIFLEIRLRKEDSNKDGENG